MRPFTMTGTGRKPALLDRLGRPQSFVAKYENGDRRLDVVEFLTITEILDADPHEIIESVKSG